MIALRRRHEALQRGTFRTLAADDAEAVYAFERCTPNERVVVILNNSDRVISHRLTDLPAAAYEDEVSGRRYAAENGTITVEVAPRWGAVLVERR